MNDDIFRRCTFYCSLEEDFAAAAGENPIVAARSLVRAHQADFMSPALSLCGGCSSAPFLPGDRIGRSSIVIFLVFYIKHNFLLM